MDDDGYKVPDKQWSVPFHLQNTIGEFVDTVYHFQGVGQANKNKDGLFN